MAHPARPVALPGVDAGAFEAFVVAHEARLVRALTATYGPTVGREAAVDALSWAWEHWDRLGPMANPVGYLYRVGQTAARRALGGREVPFTEVAVVLPDVVEPGLLPALRGLSEQQRTVVVLVHGYGWSLRETAELLGCSLSTVRNHLERALTRLRSALEVEHAHDR